MRDLAIALLLFLPCAVLAGCGGDGADGTEHMQIKYVALGASDAAGIGADPLTDGYVFRIAGQLEACTEDTTLVNLGIPGAKVREMEDVEVPLALAENPDIVTVWAGPNDLVGGTPADEFELRFRRVITRLQAAGPSLIAVADLPDLTQLPRFQTDPDPDVTPARIVDYNQIIYAVAGDNGADVVRLSAVPLNDSLVASDGFHPSNAGHRLIAEEFMNVIAPQVCR